LPDQHIDRQPGDRQLLRPGVVGYTAQPLAFMGRFLLAKPGDDLLQFSVSFRQQLVILLQGAADPGQAGCIRQTHLGVLPPADSERLASQGIRCVTLSDGKTPA